MNKTLLSVLLLTSSFYCMAMEQCSEVYKKQYNMEYKEVENATKGLPPAMQQVLAPGLIQQEMGKKLEPDVLNGRVDAIIDFVQGKPNKFGK